MIGRLSVARVVVAVALAALLGCAAVVVAQESAPKEPIDWEQRLLQPSTYGWFAFQAENDNGPSVISMNDWLEKPAGVRGGVRMVGDRFEFEDGTPVKFWGINIASGDAAPAKVQADWWSAWFAKYGINAIRMHKFADSIGDSRDMTKMRPEAMDNLDYFAAKLKEHGIYFGWSHSFFVKVGPENRDRLLNYDELMNNAGGRIEYLIHFAEDVQDLFIERVVNMLNHVNPYTGLRYADEPALAFIEIINESDIFFYPFRDIYNALPTYRQMLIERFSDWLREKYGDHEGLVAAWGEAALNAYEIQDEHLDKRNIYVQPNPWFMGVDGLAQAENLGTRQRLLDNAIFLHEVQNEFYQKFVRAVRETGYEGPILASNWQAPKDVPHYYNLRSDYLVGYIDRHGYFGGQLSNTPIQRAFNNDSMLTMPGTGYFNRGMEQVIDRPFVLSEWVHVYPNEWLAEGPPLIAAYGLGLQGWDGSYPFSGTTAGRGFANRLGGTNWNPNVPNFFGQLPALARMVYRGDVAESEPISIRRVSLAELETGELNFVETGQPLLEPGEVFSPSSLAVGRTVVEFVDEPQPSVLPDLSQYVDGNVIRSVTGELTWYLAEELPGRGYFTIDTAGTKGVVGFAGGTTSQLGDWTIELESPFASLIVTALEQEADLSTARSALVSVFARTRNYNMRFGREGNSLISQGGIPLFMEPVQAAIQVKGRAVAEVHVLDHDGRRTGVTLPVEDGRFTIDGNRDQAVYYEIVFEE